MLIGVLQQSLNRFTARFRLPVVPLKVDGLLGPETKRRVVYCKKALGYAEKYQTWHGAQTNRMFLRQLEHPTISMNPRQIARGLRARRRLRAGTKRERVARAILAHPNAGFEYVSPTGGSAKAGIAAQAAGRPARVAATGGTTNIDQRVLDFLLELSKKGHVQINSVVNAAHRTNSQHYVGEAVDVGKGSSGGAISAIYKVAANHGLTVLDEDRYHFHVYV